MRKSNSTTKLKNMHFLSQISLKKVSYGKSRLFVKSEKKKFKLGGLYPNKKNAQIFNFPKPEAKEAYGLGSKQLIKRPPTLATSSSDITVNIQDQDRQSEEKQAINIVQYSFVKRVEAMFQIKRNSIEDKKDTLKGTCQYFDDVESSSRQVLMQKRRKIEELKREKREVQRKLIENVKKIGEKQQKIKEQRQQNQMRIKIYQNIIKSLSVRSRRAQVDIQSPYFVGNQQKKQQQKKNMKSNLENKHSYGKFKDLNGEKQGEKAISKSTEL